MSGPSRRLRVEHLEDRAVPAAAGFDLHGILVAVPDVARETDRIAEVIRSPLSEGVERLGLGVYKVDLPAGVSVDTAVRGLSQLGGVVASPDYRVMPAAAPNDPRFGSQWSLGSARLNAAAGWAGGTGTGRTVVAVIDTGVDYTHPDLAANMWRNPGEVAGNGRDDDGNGFADDVYGADFLGNDGNPMDDSGHGTHVAGIIGAVGNNGVGMSGVAWTTRVMALRFMSGSAGGLTSDAVRALDYAVAHGAKVVNASWGGGGYYAPLAAAIGRAQAAGVVFVAAAGNNSADTDATPYFPAGYVGQLDNVVSVAATDTADNLAWYSNYGRTSVTLAAPGSSVLSTMPGGGYGTKSGTSMAAPHVAGALAVLWDRNPGLSYQQVIAKLKAAVDPLPALAGKTQAGGRLDLGRLIDAPVSPPPPASPPPATGDRVGPAVTGATFSGSRAGTYDRVTVQFSESVNPATFTAADVTLSGPNGAVGVSAILPVAGSNNTRYQLMFSRPQSTVGAYVVAVGPDVRDPSGNAMSGRFTTSATLGAPATPPATGTNRTYDMTGGPRAVQDRRTTRIDFTVTDSFTVSNLRVRLDVSHARTQDLNIRLVAPDGRSVTLFNRTAGANLSGATFGGLSAFNGMSARGVWSVQVFDLADGTTGAVNGVSLNFGSGTVPATATEMAGATDTVRDAVLYGKGDELVQG